MDKIQVFIEFVTILLLFNVMILYFVLFCFVATRYVGSSLHDQGSNLHPLHWKVKSKPSDCQGSPIAVVLSY